MIRLKYDSLLNVSVAIGFSLREAVFDGAYVFQKKFFKALEASSLASWEWFAAADANDISLADQLVLAPVPSQSSQRSPVRRDSSYVTVETVNAFTATLRRTCVH